MINWIRSLEEAKDCKNYTVCFFKNDCISVTAKEAAKIKFAIMNDIKCFEIRDSLYKTAGVDSVNRNRRDEPKAEFRSDEPHYDELDPPEEQKAAMRAYNNMLSMNSYFDGNKLLNEPKPLTKTLT